MNLSRRGFLKSLLATSALAPIAPALVEAAVDVASHPSRIFFESTPGYASGNYWMVVHPSWEPIIAEWKREAIVYGQSFLRVDGDGPELLDPTRVFKGEMSYLDGIRWLADEEKPVEWGPIEPLEFDDDVIDLIARRRALDEPGWSPMKRMTRAELLSAGFPTV